jgi:hypothetical protein
MINVIQTQTANVTTLLVVTAVIAVTREIIAAQGASSLSPVSPLKSLSLYIRAIRVWGCHPSPVTVVTGLGGRQSRKEHGGDQQISTAKGSGNPPRSSRRDFIAAGID